MKMSSQEKLNKEAPKINKQNLQKLDKVSTKKQTLINYSKTKNFDKKCVIALTLSLVKIQYASLFL